jgi:hypothetical protein
VGAAGAWVGWAGAAGAHWITLPNANTIAAQATTIDEILLNL